MTALRVFPGNSPAELAAPFSAALGRTSSRDNPLHGVPKQFSGKENYDDPHTDKDGDKIRMHGLKADLQASFACGQLDSKVSSGWPDSVAVIFSSIPDQRGTNTDYHATLEKSVKAARRVPSTSLNWGKQRLAQEAGLFRDVLLHKNIVTEVLVFFQWHLLIAVITHSYESPLPHPCGAEGIAGLCPS